MKRTKVIDHSALNGSVARRQSNRRAEVRIARSLDDLLMVYAVRSVYIAEQVCPFAQHINQARLDIAANGVRDRSLRVKELARGSANLAPRGTFQSSHA
jgi:hypothetical protein